MSHRARTTTATAALVLVAACAAFALAQSHASPRTASTPPRVSESQFLEHVARSLQLNQNPLARQRERGDGSECCLDTVREELLTTVVRHPDSGRAYFLLGECNLALNRYEDAAEALAGAAALPGGEASARSELARAQRLSQVKKAAQPHLPPGSEVIQIAAFSPPRAGRLWAVVSGQPEPPASEQRGLYHDIRLTVLSDTQPDPQVRWQSDPLLVPQLHAHGVDDFIDIPLVVLHQRGNPDPHLALEQTYPGGSWTPSHLSIFRWDGHQLRKLFGAMGEDPVWVEDVNGDGRSEIGVTYAIGYDLSHAEMPRWTDLYAWNGRAYVLANGQFPREFGDIARQLRTARRAYPDDYELLKYQGILDEIQRRPHAALAHLRRAERFCQSALQAEDDRALRASLAHDLTDLRSRLARLSSTGHRKETGPAA